MVTGIGVPKWKTRLLKTASIAALWHALYGPDILLAPPFDDTATRGPNPVQQEVLRLLAQSHDYVAIGDTDHRVAEINVFADHANTVGALARGGIRHYFIESSPSAQPLLDTIQRSGGDKVYNSRQLWICDDRANKAITDTFNNSLTQNADQVRFVAADTRQDEDGLTTFNAFENAAIMAAFKFHEVTYGCISRGTFVVANILSGLALTRKATSSLMDDRKTVDYIRAFNGKGGIRFGAGHFEDVGPGAKGMPHLLEEQGKTVAVTKIYQDVAGHRASSGGRGRQPDIVFYVTPSPSVPHGVWVANPAYQKYYDQAKKAVAATPS